MELVYGKDASKTLSSRLSDDDEDGDDDDDLFGESKGDAEDSLFTLKRRPADNVDNLDSSRYDSLF